MRLIGCSVDPGSKEVDMWHIGIDLHRRTVVAAAPVTFGCQDTDRIIERV